MVGKQLSDEVLDETSFDVDNWLLCLEAEEEEKVDMHHSLYKIPEYLNEGE